MAEGAALYWTKEAGSLIRLIMRVESVDDQEANVFRELSREMIRVRYFLELGSLFLREAVSGELKYKMRVLLISNMWPSLKHPHYGVFVENTYRELLRDGLDVSKSQFASMTPYLESSRNTLSSSLRSYWALLREDMK